jgi:hypothetical protein
MKLVSVMDRTATLFTGLVVCFVAGTTGCVGGDCTLIALPGIRVTIVDGSTGLPFQEEVTVIATEGSYSETDSPPVRPGEPRIASLAFERPGTYRVEVQSPGYVTEIATNVRVTRDDCHVRTVELTARLESAGT